MFVLNMLLAIAGMAILICILFFLVYKILRGKKNIYSWFTLIIAVFFLSIAFWQSIKFFKVF